jgi:iron complex transport system ATP-binding protein
MTPLLAVSGLRIAIGDRELCRDLDLTVRPGERWAVLGRNGAGKSTLLHHIAGLRRAQRGVIRVGDAPLDALSPRARAGRIALLLQHSSRGVGANVWETVMTGRYPTLTPLQRESEQDAAIVQSALEKLDLVALSNRPLDALSGGELRRVELARLLTQQAPLNLLDEPLNHLDPAYQVHCLGQVLEDCVTPERAVMIVAHDLNLAYQACENWLVIHGDGSWERGAREVIADPERLSDLFGHRIERFESHGRVIFSSPFVRPARHRANAKTTAPRA